MTTVSDVTQPVDLAEIARPLAPGRWRGSLPPRAVVSIADGVVVGVVAGWLLEFSIAASALVALLWAVLTVVSAPARVAFSSGARGVLRAAVAAALLCWVLHPLLDLGVDPDRLVVLVALALAAALILRGALALAPHEPLRVVVVGEIGDRDAIAAEAHRLGGGALTAVASVGPTGLVAAIGSERPDAVLAVPGPGFAGRQVQRVAWQAERLGVPLLVSTRLLDVTPTRAVPLRLGALSLVHVAHASRVGLGHAVKTVWERSAALTGLVLLSPLLLAVAIAIRLDSPGPVLFRQVRVGRDGAPFTMLKFRTMCADAEQRLAQLAPREGHVLFKMARDPRVTRVGALLRRYSLDELPQLINILRGDMSLVGPRPCLPTELEQYDEDPMRRLAVSPGLTGLWQVSGRSDLSWEDSVRLDLDYVDNWSLGLDLRIVARTARAVLRHEGAY